MGTVVLYIMAKKMALSVISALAPVAQMLDSAIHWIYLYPVDKYWGNQSCYQLDKDLSVG